MSQALLKDRGNPPPRAAYFAHQVYADRYLELLDSPVELFVANTAPGFTISVQMTSSDVGPYACLIFHDPVATLLTAGELQQQFNGPYSDFTTAQVMYEVFLCADFALSVSWPLAIRSKTKIQVVTEEKSLPLLQVSQSITISKHHDFWVMWYIAQCL